MTKKELHKLEVAQRMEIRRIAKETRDAAKAEKSRLFAEKKQIWAQRKLDKAAKDLEEANFRKLVCMRQHQKYFSELKHLISVIKENILLGDNNKLIEKSMFKGIRHFSYDLSQNENYSLNKLLGIRKEGKTPEHVNGRTNVGVYCLWLMITGKINTWEEFYNYLLKYACTLHTTPEFNRSIEKFQNHEEAITPEIYIREYEKEFNCKFNEEQKTLFAGRFLSTHYEKITRSTVIDLIREMK